MSVCIRINVPDAPPPQKKIDDCGVFGCECARGVGAGSGGRVAGGGGCSLKTQVGLG